MSSQLYYTVSTKAGRKAPTVDNNDWIVLGKENLGKKLNHIKSISQRSDLRGGKKKKTPKNVLVRHVHRTSLHSLLLPELGRWEGLLPHNTFLCEGVLCVQVSVCGHGLEQFSSLQYSRANSPPTPWTLDEHTIQIWQSLKSESIIYQGIPQALRGMSLQLTTTITDSIPHE